MRTQSQVRLGRAAGLIGEQLKLVEEYSHTLTDEQMTQFLYKIRDNMDTLIEAHETWKFS